MNHSRIDEGGKSRMTECHRGPWRGRVAVVGGCGHVGLPLGMVLAKAGLRVDLVDTSAERVALVNRSRMPFEEEGADGLLPGLVESGLLRATTDGSAVSAA